MTPMQRAYIGLGSNLGERDKYLNEAVLRLDRHPSVAVERCSSIYETAPVGFTDQPDFLNMAVSVRTRLSPEALLDALLAIEGELGRVREIRWGPRIIDLDLLIYGNETRSGARLALPHPRMFERAFVLVPLLEVWDPSDAAGLAAIQRAADQLQDRGDVRLWRKTNWPSASGLFAN